MSTLRPGDEHFHYSDSSHRWIAPPDIDQKVWDAGVRAHLCLHLTTMGGPTQSDKLRERRSSLPAPMRRIPRQRQPMPPEKVVDDGAAIRRLPRAS